MPQLVGVDSPGGQHHPLAALPCRHFRTAVRNEFAIAVGAGEGAGEVSDVHLARGCWAFMSANRVRRVRRDA